MNSELQALKDRDWQSETLEENIPRTKIDQIELLNGKRLYWYYEDELNFWLKDLNIEDREGLKEVVLYEGHSGIIVGQDGIDVGNLDIENCLVIIDQYPCEKCYPEIGWESLARLVDNENLVEFLEIE